MNTKYAEYKQLNLTQISDEILSKWQSENTFEQCLKLREGAKPFIFFEGPPSANGQPGIHHVMARAIKDIFCRYKTQKGYFVARKAGWDTHGLPVELGVEKQLGITKEDIGKKISVDEYNAALVSIIPLYLESKDRTLLIVKLLVIESIVFGAVLAGNSLSFLKAHYDYARRGSRISRNVA